MAGFCESGNENFEFHKSRTFLDKLSHYQLLRILYHQHQMMVMRTSEVRASQELFHI